ncbi:MAG: hypothetical protein CMO75_09855 [Verrucomicrobiales bacterium]|nr:hypothetical protein [Verrucomicrobiales bacterium]
MVWKFPPFIFLLAFVSLGQAEVLLNRGSDWRYLKGTPMPGEWLAEDFDYSVWPSIFSLLPAFSKKGLELS